MCIYWWETTINKWSNKYWSKSDAYKRCAQKWSKRGQEGPQEWAADFMPSGWGRSFWRFLCQRRTEGRRWGDERPRGNSTARISAQREGGQKAAEGQTGRVGQMPRAGRGRMASGSTAAQAACTDTGRRPWGLRRQLLRWRRWHLRGRSGSRALGRSKGRLKGPPCWLPRATWTVWEKQTEAVANDGSLDMLSLSFLGEGQGEWFM